MQYIYGKYKYFDLLVLINNHYFPSDNFGENVRDLDEKSLLLYNKLLEDFFNKFKTNISFDEIIESSLNLTGYIWLQQPFFDGNTRTLQRFLKLVFRTLEYNLDLNKENDSSFIIPLFYFEDETCTQYDIDKFKRRLTKVNNS